MTNDTAFPFQKLDVYVAARALAARVHAMAVRDAELRDQARRASKSVLLNLAEGLPLEAPGKRRQHFEIANGSLHETVAALDLAAAIGVADAGEGAEAMATAARIKRMLRGLAARAG